MDIAHNAQSPSAATVVWRVVTGILSMLVGTWLLSISMEFTIPTITALAMLTSGMASVASVIVSRLVDTGNAEPRLIKG